MTSTSVPTHIAIGATRPYLAGRLDHCHEMILACAEAIISGKNAERVFGL